MKMSLMIHPDVKKAVFFAKRQLSELVCDAVNLEGIPYTIPEIQTLLEGITVGGYKISDQEIVLNLVRAWKFLFTKVTQNSFSVSASFAKDLHAIAAGKKALESERFRTGKVTIAQTNYVPPHHSELEKIWGIMEQELIKIDDVCDKAIYLFLTMVSARFFNNMNRGIGRFMMNGLLMSHGYPVINIPAKRSVEFHKKMLAYYENQNPEEMKAFLLDCYDERILSNFI